MYPLMESYYTYLIAETINNKDYYEDIAFNILDKKANILVKIYNN